MYKNISFLIILLLSFFVGHTEGDWKLKTDKDGIKIFSKKVADSKVNIIKVECELAATPSQLVAVILDINTSDQWQYNTKNFSIVKKVSPSDLYYYAEINFPWPTSNRDFVSHLTVNQDTRTRVVTVDALTIAGMVPVKSNIIRLNRSNGRWTIVPLNKNLVKVEYILRVDPEGSVPDWLTNLFSFKGPFETFKSLRQQLKKPAYAAVNLPFIID